MIELGLVVWKGLFALAGLLLLALLVFGAGVLLLAGTLKFLSEIARRVIALPGEAARALRDPAFWRALRIVAACWLAAVTLSSALVGLVRLLGH
ncbi:MAG: hypothetical protein M3336_04605 [Chloroflexota bacterium]|nr:hypothetical protein [Chloroflexota bacterium]